MENTGRLLQDTVYDHITDSIAANHRHMATLDHTDLSRAADLAEKHLRRRLGKKIQTSQLAIWICEETDMAFNSKSKPATAGVTPTTGSPTTITKQEASPAFGTVTHELGAPEPATSDTRG